MRNRLKLGLKIAGVIGLLSAAVTVPVIAQTPQYYAPTVSPAPPGTFPPSTVRPGYGVNTNPGAPNKPRLTQPVIAGADGVRPVSANDFDLNKPEVPKLPPAGGSGSAAPPFLAPPPATLGFGSSQA